MAPLHPAFVHIPIGLLIGNAILTLWYLRAVTRPDRQMIEQSALYCLQLGVLALLPAVASGTWEAIRYVSRADADPAFYPWVNAHALAGVLVLIVYWQAWTLRRRRPDILVDERRRRGYLVRLGLGVLLLAVSGGIGGHMVYVLGLGRP